MTTFKSNCIIETLKAFRADDKRGKIVARRSRCGKFYHFYYERLDGVIVSFVPPEDQPRKKFPTVLFDGYLISNDKAWRCQEYLIDWGVDADLLHKMSDNQVMAMYDTVIAQKEKMKGDPT